MDASIAIADVGIRVGFPNIALPAADHALEVLPKNGWAHDTRGKVRAADGDFAGAVEDFEFFLNKNDPEPQVASLRRTWIAKMKSGQPVTAQELLLSSGSSRHEKNGP